MASKFTPKKKKIKGTNSKDKITWVSKRGWKSTLTVNAGGGSDIINFKKSKYKNKLYGQNGNDKIYAGTNDDTIHGNSGNDLIYGYNGNDKLYGDAGKDKLFGGNGNDSIYGGKGYDTINAGLGNNTIYFNKGDGKDTVLNGKGVDTLVFANEITATFSAKFVGNDLVLTGKNGKNTVTLKDYGKGDHSAQWTTIGKTTVRTDSLVAKNNNITTTTDTHGYKQYTGTTRPDNMIISDYSDETVINGLAGDDYIEIIGGNASEYWDAYERPLILGGGGNDTISLNHARATLKIDQNSGSDTIVNAYKYYSQYDDEIAWGSSGGYSNGITLDIKGNEDLLLRESVKYKYISGIRKDNDLIIKLTNGETLTIKDYYTVEHSYYNNRTYYSSNNGGGYIEAYLKLDMDDAPIVTLNKNNTNLDRSKSTDKNIIVAKDNANYNIKAGNGDGNEIAITGNGNHNIELGSGIDNEIYVMNGPLPIDEDDYTAINGNVTVKTGNWNNSEERHFEWPYNSDSYTYYYSGFSYYSSIHPNTISVNANGKINITTGKSLNDIHASSGQEVNIISNGIDEIYADGNKNTITSNNCADITIGGSSYYSPNHHPENTVYSNGYDQITVNDGATTINLAKGTNADSGKKYIISGTEDLVTVNGIFNADRVGIGINDGSYYSYYSNYVFTHYDSEDERDANGNGTGHITIYQKKSNGDLTSQHVQINGNWVTKNGVNLFDLAEYDYTNNKPVIDDYIDVVWQGGTPTASRFSSMQQYVDMNKLDDDDGTDIYAHDFYYYDDILYDIHPDVYVKGSTSNDKYSYEAGEDGNVIIKENGGNDSLTILNDTQYFRLFFDVSITKSGDEITNINIGNDLIITSYGNSDAEFSKLFSRSYSERNSVRKLTIKDFFNEDGGSIKTIRAEYKKKIGNNNVTHYEDLNYNNLINQGTFGTGIHERNSIVADVAAWLSDKGYSSVSSAIQSDGLSDTDRSDLRFLYTHNPYYYGQYWGDAYSE
jgi:Ca2+-binding RTX toxin-like protein